MPIVLTFRLIISANWILVQAVGRIAYKVGGSGPIVTENCNGIVLSAHFLVKKKVKVKWYVRIKWVQWWEGRSSFLPIVGRARTNCDETICPLIAFEWQILNTKKECKIQNTKYKKTKYKKTKYKLWWEYLSNECL